MYDIDCSGTEDEVIAREAEKAASRYRAGWRDIVGPLVRIILAFVAALGGGSVMAALNRAKSPVWPWVKDVATAVGMPDASLGDVLTEVRRLRAGRRSAAQALIERIGAPGPEDIEQTAERAAQRIERLSAELAETQAQLARVARESDATEASLRAQIEAFTAPPTSNERATCDAMARLRWAEMARIADDSEDMRPLPAWKDLLTSDRDAERLAMVPVVRALASGDVLRAALTACDDSVSTAAKSGETRAAMIRAMNAAGLAHAALSDAWSRYDKTPRTDRPAPLTEAEARAWTRMIELDHVSPPRPACCDGIRAALLASNRGAIPTDVRPVATPAEQAEIIASATGQISPPPGYWDTGVAVERARRTGAAS